MSQRMLPERMKELEKEWKFRDKEIESLERQVARLEGQDDRTSLRTLGVKFVCKWFGHKWSHTMRFCVRCDRSMQEERPGG